MNIKINLDAMGIATSVACAIHCALLPLLISSLPILGINIIHNLVFEWGMIGLAFIVGSYSLFHGYVKHHRSTAPLLIFATGFIFLVLKQVVPQFEYLFLSIAVVLIITAHFYNYRLCNLSKYSSTNHQH
jgi:hypothetical protein